VTADPAAGDTYLPEHGDWSYGVDHYDLALRYRPASNRLDGVAALAVTAREPISQVAVDLTGLAVRRVRVGARRATKYRQRKDKLLVTLPERAKAGDSFVVEIAYSGTPEPVRGTWGAVGWEELADGVLVAGQPDGAPSWFPCNDRPSDKAGYRIAVTVPHPYTVIANGWNTERRTGAGSTTWVYEQVEPMASYLATVQIGRYDISDIDGVPPVRIVRPHRLAEAARRDFARQDDMIRTFSALFGDYPFRSYGVVVTDDPLEIPLEAQGLSIFGANHVDGRGAHERLVAHELAHQWFGNSLTVASWRDIWLNEGFACYAEWLWSENSDGPPAAELAAEWWRRMSDLDQRLVLSDPGPESMFDDQLYKRGALTLHAVRTTIGDERFFELIRSWVEKHRHGTVDTDGFVDHAARFGGPGIRTLLSAWLTAPALQPLPTADAH
jgi:aminopeptidase